ncbi:PH domain-containing protein [Paenibacillus sp. B1-33]|uniref:PH domain-containing protein n=1 Tax=unclassified Paenibacillus TaxID=185978 RepID=UPI003D2A5765
MKNKEMRLHPLHMGFSILQVAKAIWPFLILYAWKAKDHLWIQMLFAAIVVYALIDAVLDWRRFTFRFEEDKLVINKGIFVREEKTIFYRRIHSVRLEQSFLQRLSRTAQLKIETPGGEADGDGVLPTLSLAHAEELRTVLMLRKQGTEHIGLERGDVPTTMTIAEAVDSRSSNNVRATAGVDQMDQDRQTKGTGFSARDIRLGIGTLFLSSATTIHLGMLLAFYVAITNFADDLLKLILPEGLLKKIMDQVMSLLPSHLTYIVLGVGGFILAWFISTLLFVAKYYRFTAVVQGEEIVISYGLFEKKVNAFKPGRVQEIIVKEGMLRQLLGYAQVEVGVLSADKKESLLLHPLVRVRDIPDLVAHFVPQVNMDQNTVQHRPPGRSWWYYVRMELLLFFIAHGLLYWWQGTMAHWLWLLMPILLGMGTLRLKDAGMGIQDKQLMIRTRAIARKSHYMLRPHIVSISAKDNYFQRQRCIRSLRVTIMSGHSYTANCFSEQDVARVWLWYSRKKGE